MSEDDWTAIATTRRQRQANDWVLVLHSEGVEAEARRTREGFVVETPADAAERARALLATWERENVREPEPPPEPLAPFPWLSMTLLSAALLGFFAITGPREGGSDWFVAGAARSSSIQAGEWWRAVTALTLHADAGHVLGNVLAATLFAGAVCRRFGSGVGFAALVAAGTVGNLANAFFRSVGHSSVGASTAVFAAVGVLAADALVRRRAPRGGRLAPLGAGLGILAMLGTSERADVWAHFFGLVAGVGVGLPLAALLARAPASGWQLAAGTLATGVLLGAWRMAR